MAYVAAGRCDGFWQRDLNYWDIAAGLVLVKEAGGFVTDFNGENFINTTTGGKKLHNDDIKKYEPNIVEGVVKLKDWSNSL